ncbi:MAG TPA: N-acetylmuramic acid 6-phosphate etherase [Planctomycetota bacterium]|jgi:N-acetylmuramic acid 6-phosphate etherase|nr:N-acetylmuramic acid 6-phosphate etherase [Planctomycetota bacterium]NMD34777.1 N-acetylmuramic acid 6-phosphate etherase [Planctomycetota bacterium]HNS00046.1 N-acetylmuramic acid 6-phosphate etherase [Planctomycetota bacterium]HNU25385.1 N-acetylmuramic acid 6-phosphate etherase [Planctomycetota bacterium]HOE29346.1 N-acetylmuramic acid 6-phosphate etherase [Planctomycetota bacterium]
MFPPEIPPTELSNPRSSRLDALSPAEAAALLMGEEAEAVAALKDRAHSVAEVAVWAADSLRRGGRLIYVGAGTSGRLGVLDAVECVPTFRTEPRQVVGIIAGGPAALTRAVEGAEDNEEEGRAQVRGLEVDARDTVVGIAASGRTPFVLAALREAKARGARAALVTAGHPPPGEPLDALVLLPSGPEVLTGSTRLKAGTATKIVLNAISTTAMICLGKVYRNLMVDLRPTNNKLRARAVRLVRELTGAEATAARAALEAAQWSVKVAVIALRRGLEPEAAERLLAQHGGFLGKALGEAP